jgi:GTP pyrophosphokinase
MNMTTSNNMIFYNENNKRQHLLNKLQDRLSTLKNIADAPQNIQYFIAKETVDFFAPLAHKYGFYEIKNQLEQISLRYLDPDAYKFIEQKLTRSRSDLTKKMNDIKIMIQQILQKKGIKFHLYARVKSHYSIYNKMKKQNIPFSKIKDIFALRIIVNSITDCYTVLSCLKENREHLHERFRDYILNPKLNGYQSIHIKLKLSNIILEAQIRTWEMHKKAEKGCASHFKYKELINLTNINFSGEQKKTEKNLNWKSDLIKQMIKGKGIILQSAKNLIIKPATANIHMPDSKLILVKNSGKQRKDVSQITRRLLRAKSINSIIGTNNNQE